MAFLASKLNFLFKAVTLFWLSATSAPADSRQKIAIIDTGLRAGSVDPAYLCKDGHKSFIPGDLSDTHSHGTLVTTTIARRINPATQCLLIYKWTSGHTRINDVGAIIKAIRAAVTSGAAIINMSLSGPDLFVEEFYALQAAIRAGIHVVVSAGNNGFELRRGACGIYPACYAISNPRYHVVGSLYKGTRPASSNYGPIVADWAEIKDAGFGGTSAAAAVFSGELAWELANGRKK